MPRDGAPESSGAVRRRFSRDEVPERRPTPRPRQARGQRESGLEMNCFRKMRSPDVKAEPCSEPGVGGGKQLQGRGGASSYGCLEYHTKGGAKVR